MKLQRLLCKAVCVVTAAALFLMPLAACDDDSDSPELRGMKVTEEELRERVDAMIDNKNFTVEFNKEGERIGDEGRMYSTEIYKYDLENKVAYSELYNNYIEQYYLEIENEAFNVIRYPEKSPLWEAQVRKKNPDDLVYEIFIDSNFIGMYNIMAIFNEAIYDESNMSYVLREKKIHGNFPLPTTTYTHYLYILEDTITHKTIYVHKNQQQEIIENYIYTEIFKDIGTTTIDVPDEVYAAIEEYKANESNR